jgi:uncharacterized membrane protein YdjX (TVP38/TMEM64 family)
MSALASGLPGPGRDSYMIKQNKKILLLAVFIAVIIALRLSPIGSVLTFENLKGHREALFSFVQGHYLQSVTAYVMTYVIIAALSIPGAAIMTLAGGFLFGVLPATLYIDIGATIGATLAFLSARYLLGTWLQEKYRIQLGAFNAEMEKNGLRYLLIVRLIPVFPFFMINFLSGLTKVRVRTFVWTTALGIVPVMIVFAYAGQQIGTINTVSEILSPRTIGALAVLAGAALLPAVFKRIGERRKRE